MIIVCFGQGLGNQMFQYAFYSAMKETYPKTDVRMEIDAFLGSAHNGFELDRIFGIEKNEVSLREAVKYANRYPQGQKLSSVLRPIWAAKRKIAGINENHIRFADGTPFEEKVFHLDPAQNYILEGFWTNIKYFDFIRNQVVNAFRFQKELEGRNLIYKEQIENSNSVGVHIRHGDYAASGFYILDINYYKKAFEILESRESNLKFFFFSDDIQFVKKEFSYLSNYEIVEGNKGSDSYIDMQLMSLCKHNIIANSSFSFWGAYLNKNPEKIVIAPDKLSKANKEGLFCPEWIVLTI